MIEVTEKYEYNGWPSLKRPDLKPPEGWSLSLMTAVNRIRNHNLSPDGQQMAFIWDRDDQSDIYVMPVTGGWPRRITTNRAAVAYWDDEIPQWSPDGQWLAFILHGNVHLAPAVGGLPKQLTRVVSGTSSPCWLPDGRQLIVSVEHQDCSTLAVVDRDGRSIHLLDADNGDNWDARPSPDGRVVAFVHRPHNDLNRWEIRLVEVESGQVQSLTGTPQQRDWEPRWSPNGKTLAFLSQQSGFNEVWLIRPEGDGLRQLTHLGMDVAELYWSPEGKRLACTVNHDGAFHLAVIDAESGEVTYVRQGQGVWSRPQWSPAGDALHAANEDSIRPPDLYRVAVADGTTIQLTFSNLPALEHLNLVAPEPVTYRSFDGLEIPAFLYWPERPNGAAVVYPHGGPTGQYGYDWDILAQYFVAKGYTYLAPNFRGSTGYGVVYERANYGDWGKGDTQDCLYGARYLHTLAWIDQERIAIYGGSYGGYMTACCLSRDPDYLFACGVAKYGDAHLFTSWAQCNRHLRLYSEVFLGHPARNRPVYLDGSPLYQVENVQKPVLILHGLLDDVCPPQSSEEWAQALRRAGKTFEYKTYAGEPHGFLKRRTQLDAYERIERFLDWYLLP